MEAPQKKKLQSTSEINRGTIRKTCLHGSIEGIMPEANNHIQKLGVTISSIWFRLRAFNARSRTDSSWIAVSWVWLIITFMEC